jgi:very-short-patch-repair endonuclease
MRTQDVTLKRARRLRGALTGAELGLWVRLRNRQLGGFRFRRQHPVGPFILDFYCPEARLAVEIDGDSHGLEGREAHDARRDAWLLSQGVQTFRISADAAKDPESAAATILEVVRRHAPSVTA